MCIYRVTKCFYHAVIFLFLIIGGIWAKPFTFISMKNVNHLLKQISYKYSLLKIKIAHFEPKIDNNKLNG